MKKEILTCHGCKYLSEFGCTVVQICTRHELFNALSSHEKDKGIDRFVKGKTK